VSVHGEFERYLEATLDALRRSGRADLQARADDLEREVARADASLEERARRVLDGPLGEGSSPSVPSPAAEPAEGLLAISRIILGR